MTGREWVAIVGPGAAGLASRIAALAERPDWVRQAFSGDGAIFTRPQCPYVAPADPADAVLLGPVLDRHGPGDRPAQLDEAIWQSIRSGSADPLLARFWGGFVLLSWVEGRLQVFREPSAAMPCYYAAISGGVLIGSSIAALIDAGLPRPSVEMERIADVLYRADLPWQDTALTGVHELLPGDALTISHDSFTVRQTWSPWGHVAIDANADFAEHAERVRRAVQNAVAGWCEASGPALVGVSGGLDSSILAACMSRKGPLPICVTLATDDAEGDERAYARQVCDHLGLALLEAEYDLADIAIDRPARPDLPRPTGRLIAQGYSAAVARAAQAHGVQAFFTGNGGDNVFAFSQSAGALADRLIYEGPFVGSWRTARDICRLTGCSLGQAGRAALRLLARPRRYRWRPDRRFLARSVVADLDRQPLVHPWLDAPSGALPGKAAHIASLLRIQRHLDGTGQLGEVAVVNPLMALPVIEACLAIPSWMWCQGGRNRSMAREAFRADLPRGIVERVSKGGPDAFGARIVEHFRGAIRDRLLGGNLASGGIIDRGALERRLSDERPDWGPDRVRLLELLEAEAWIDHWRAR